MRALAWVSAVGVVLLVSGVALAQGPRLVSATQSQGHVKVAFRPGDLSPLELIVAVSSRRLATGPFPPANVRLRQTIRASTSRTGLVHVRARKALPPGTYYVEVSGIETGGVTDCMPHQTGCGEEWSNVRRVVIPSA
jgi:hypothetical protein